MQALVVTSRITFVPENYDRFVLAVAESPHVAGLLVVDNAAPALYAKAVGAMATGAWRFGARLLANGLWRRSEARRRAAYGALGKGVWVCRSVNEPGALALVRERRFDLVVHARTRCIFKAEALEAPPLGCINVHHGLLPDQRGVMCDLWALSRGEPAGFSVHRMTRKIDDGDILRVEPVGAGDRDYGAYLLRSSAREAEVMTDLLDEIARTGRVAGRPNTKTERTVMRKNPTWAEVRAMRARGMKL